MSRIGNKILTIPASVTIEVNEHDVLVKGPKGSLTVKVPNGINVKVEGTEVSFTRDNEMIKNLHGTVSANAGRDERNLLFLPPGKPLCGDDPSG